MQKKKIIAVLLGVLLILGVVGVIISKKASQEQSGEVNEIKEQTESESSQETDKEPVTEKKDDNVSDDGGTEQMQDDAETANAEFSGYYGALQVKGTKLCDADGNPVQLKGVSSHGLAWFPQYINDEFIKQLHDEWHANVLRLAMYTAESGGYCTDGDKEKLKQLIDDGVKYATAHNMYVIIDWHTLSDNNPHIYEAEAEEFWGEISEKYADYENVLYEICNEPNNGTSWQEVKSYAEKIISLIRQKDQDAVILVGTPNWCQFVDEAAADPITGQENIMYTLHFYAATHKEELRKTMVSAVEAGLPVFVSEYGICEASGNGLVDVAQADAWVETMDQYDISYVAWNLANKDEASSMIQASCDKTSGFSEEDLSEEGKWVYQMLTGGGQLPQNTTSAEDKGENQQGSQDKGQDDGAAQDEKNAADQKKSTADGVQSLATGNDNLKAELELLNSWEAEGTTFYQYAMTIENASGSDISGWSAEIVFDSEVTLSDGWNGVYNVNGKTLKVAPADYNTTVPAKKKVTDLGFIVSVK